MNSVDHPQAAARVAFFGAITASVTHELNNVMGIINELSGLLEDLLYEAGPDVTIKTEKLNSLHERLARQVLRGRTVIKRLNTFAHTTDQPTATFDVNQIMDNLAGLIQRFADLKKVDLETHFADKPILATGDPFGIQQTVFLGFKHCLALVQDGAKIRLTVEEHDRRFRIAITAKPAGPGAADDGLLATLTTIASETGGEVAMSVEPDMVRMVLAWPLSPATE